MSERKVRIGVIGAGRFAEQAHIPGIQAHAQGEVAALCARTRERTAAMAERFGVPRIYTDYHELLAQPDIDAVTVATPDAMHYPVALAALEAGKHVFCEKPLTKDAGEARRLTEAAQRAGLVNMVAFTFRYTRALPALRQLIRAGELGTVFAVNMHVHWGGVGYPRRELAWREQAAASTAGIWGDGGAHLLDALAYLLAPVEAVCAQMQIVPREPGTPQPDSVDYATCLGRLRYPAAPGAADLPPAFVDRQAGTVHATLLASRMETPFGSGDEVQVVGTKAVTSVALNRGAKERANVRRRGGGWEDLPLPEDAFTERPRALDRMLGAFIEAIQRGKIDPDQDPDFRAGLRAQEALDAGLRSAEHGRWERVPEV